MHTIPLFPLHSVLFPGGPLQLRIFEARYVDMIGRCMRANSEFGVALIIEGREVGAARTASVGTTARIRDFETLRGGLLGIHARGDRRFRIQSVAIQADGLNTAEVDVLPIDPSIPVPNPYKSLVVIVREMFPQFRSLYADVDPQFEDASWLSSRLAELLPIPLPQRQQCLELDDPLERLMYVNRWMKAIADSE